MTPDGMAPDGMTADGGAGLTADVTRVLLGLTPADAAQEALRRRMLAHAAAHHDAVWRDGPSEHFTASGFVFDPTGRQVLLVLHRKGRTWWQPGGHFEPADADVAAAALREVREETGVRATPVPGLVVLDRHELSGAFGRCTAHLDLRVVAVADRRDPTRSPESDDVAWWPVDGLPAGDPAFAAEVAAARELADRAGAFGACLGDGGVPGAGLGAGAGAGIDGGA